jgi:type II secretory pathway pseudopilin PulG
MSTETSNTTVAPADTSGKKLVLVVILLGILAAGASWWYRYSATRRSAEFWGPQAATLIRSASHVTLRSDEPSPNAEGVDEADVPRDVSQAKGLKNLRDALLLDSKFDWASTAKLDTDWSSSLVFAAAEGAEPRAVVLFTSDYGWVANGTSDNPAQHAVKTTSEMAAGLQKFFASEGGAAAEQ